MDLGPANHRCASHQEYDEHAYPASHLALTFLLAKLSRSEGRSSFLRVAAAMKKNQWEESEIESAGPTGKSGGAVTLRRLFAVLYVPALLGSATLSADQTVGPQLVPSVGVVRDATGADSQRRDHGRG